MKRFIVIFILIAGLFAFKNDKTDQYHWYKGNTHSHSVVSDGDNPPFKVVKSYHDKGYNFLLLTDHNFLVNIDTVKMPENMRKDFILIPGEEVTDQKSVHTTAFNIKKYVPFSNDANSETDLKKRREEIMAALKTPNQFSKTELLQMHTDGIIKAGGIPFLNHPNFADGLQVSDILPVKNLHHMELYNGHPGVYNWGKEGHAAVEVKWDSILSSGQLMYGVSADDMHNLETNSPKDANPFRGWIMVKSSELTPEAIHNSVLNGNFYSTTSIILKTCDISKKKCVIEIDGPATTLEIANSAVVPRIDETGQVGFLTEFIGNNGIVLSKTFGMQASYKPKKTDKYIRARVTYCKKTEKGFEKLFAWSQPVFVN
jgi:hypothetical protein